MIRAPALLLSMGCVPVLYSPADTGDTAGETWSAPDNGWSSSTHATRATCNDCHVPHDLVGKYKTKGENGFWHSYYFTTQSFAEPIRATPKSRGIAEANCRRCHDPVVQAMGTPAHAGSAEISCIRCHGSVGHPELYATNVADAR